MVKTVLCVGDILLRLSTPGPHGFLDDKSLELTVGGAETNVAVGLSHFGVKTRLLSALPENDIGDELMRRLRGYDIDTGHILRKYGRTGLYFFRRGTDRRPGAIIYDRIGSVFTKISLDDLNFDKIFNSVTHVHLSGITPALGPDCSELAIAFARQAAKRDVGLSFDFNFRQKLWDVWKGEPRRVLTEIVKCATILLANDHDLMKVIDAPDGTATRTLNLADQAFAAFPRLQLITSAYRDIETVEKQSLAAEVVTREARVLTPPHTINNIIDRIGAGDAYAAGVIYGSLHGMSAKELVEFALASSLIKHTTPGDFPVATVSEVENYFGNIGQDIKR